MYVHGYLCNAFNKSCWHFFGRSKNLRLYFSRRILSTNATSLYQMIIINPELFILQNLFQAARISETAALNFARSPSTRLTLHLVTFLYPKIKLQLKFPWPARIVVQFFKTTKFISSFLVKLDFVGGLPY